MKFYSHSGIFTLQTDILISKSMDEVWAFFSNPYNLQKITPPHMNFEITSPQSTTKEVYEGMIISYNVNPVKGIRAHWITEITKVKSNHYFIDEQRFGPYSMWHHEHHFFEVPGGIKMIDKISYKIPFGPIGKLAHAIFIKRQLKGIFKYREEVLKTQFSSEETK